MKLKWTEDRFNAPLARARGMGSAHSGVTGWFHQRVTAISNFLLMAWLVCAVAHTLAGADHAAFTEWLSRPVNAILMILAVVSVFYHALLGTRVIAEDYVHGEAGKFALLIALRFYFIGGGVAAVFAILKIAFAG